MKKLTYDQVIDKIIHLSSECIIPDFQDPNLIDYILSLTLAHTKAIVDAINENIDECVPENRVRLNWL